jgi:alkylation response protein AidB-like acyl-CoA dehydrogenase
MDVRLSPEQQALRDSVAQVASRLGPRTVADLDDAERAAKLDAAVAGAGWRELRTATETGAPWASAVEAAIVAEELGRGLADTSFVGPTLAAELRRVTTAEPATGLETIAVDPTLVRLGIANESQVVAVDAAGSTVALVLVPGADGHSLATLPLPPAIVGVDLTRPVAATDARAATEVACDGVLTTDDGRRCSALGLALACADLVGAMRGAIELTAAYAKERRQYGIAIGSFQAVQHLLADAFVAMEGSRSVSLHAAWSVDALPADDALAAAALAKAYCARAARSVCETAIQVHGGVGNTWDCFAHVFLRRALFSIDFFGGIGPSLAVVLEHRGIEGAHGFR